MKDMLKKVVILDNIASPYVRQAIIVMRDYDPHMESHAVIEAERIVNAYLDDMKLKSGHAPKVRAKKKRHRFMYVIISAVIAAVITAVKYFLF